MINNNEEEVDVKDNNINLGEDKNKLANSTKNKSNRSKSDLTNAKDNNNIGNLFYIIIIILILLIK